MLLAIPVWAALSSASATAAARRSGSPRRRGRGRCVTLLLAAVWGYDPSRSSAPCTTPTAGCRRASSLRVLGVRLAGGLDLTLLGAPVAWLALRSLQRGEPAAVALAVIVAVSAVAGFTKAETERIWLPYVPLACVAAAATPITRLRPWLVAMALIAIVIKVLFGTTWLEPPPLAPGAHAGTANSPSRGPIGATPYHVLY